MSRAEFSHVVEHAESAIDRARREFLTRMTAIVHDVIPENGKLTVRRYGRIRVKLDALISEYYGEFPGDPRAIFYRLTLDEAAYARDYAVDREQARFVRYAEDHFDDSGLVQSRL